MYGGFDVFKVYLAVKLHFTSNYNYFDYDGKVNCKLETFTKRNDRYFFHKLSTKYNKDEILDFFVANFCESDKKWIGNLLQNDGRETYIKELKTTLYTILETILLTLLMILAASVFLLMMVFGAIADNIHDFCVYLFKGERLSKPSLCLKVLSFIKNWNKQIKERVVWPKIAHTITKLKPFINYNMTECKLIMKEIIVNV